MNIKLFLGIIAVNLLSITSAYADSIALLNWNQITLSKIPFLIFCILFFSVYKVISIRRKEVDKLKSLQKIKKTLIITMTTIAVIIGLKIYLEFLLTPPTPPSIPEVPYQTP